MTLTIDSVSKRYGILPSEFMSRGSSFDLYVADMANQFEQYIHRREQARSLGRDNRTLSPKPVPEISQQDMFAMIERVRNKK